MKTAHTGDLHILTGGKRAGVAERVLYGMADEWERRGVELVTVSGDFYDTHPTEEDVLFGRRWCERVTSFAKMIIISGNHDPRGAVQVLDAFRTEHRIVVVDEEPHVERLWPDALDLRVACLPDLRGAYLAQMRALWGMPRDTPTLEVAREVLRQLGSQMEGDGPRLFLGHCTLGEARMDNDQPARAQGLAFTLTDLSHIPAHAYALGHIHLRQQWLIDGAPCFYVGSPSPWDYGDLAASKSWTQLTWNGDGFDVEVVPTGAPKLVHVVGTWHRDGDHGVMGLAYAKEHATSLAVAPVDLAGADVRLRYDVPTDDAAAAETAAQEHERAILAAGAVACKVDPVPVLVSRSRAPALASARTDAEKLDAFWRATNTTPEPARRARILDVLARLQPHVPPEPPVSLLRVDGMRWAGVGRLQEPGSLSTDRDGLHAVVGPNRAGKSTLLAALTSALWCEGPKGTLDRLCRGKGAHVELDVATKDGTWTIRQNADRKTADVDDGTTYAGGREGYYAWAESRVPERAVLEQVAFLPPKRNGLLDLQDGPLKDALLTLAGSSRFKALADLVRTEGTALKGQAKAKREAVARMGDPGTALALAQRDAETTRATLTTLAAEHADGAALLDVLDEQGRVQQERDGLVLALTAIANACALAEEELAGLPDPGAARADAERASVAHAEEVARCQRAQIEAEGNAREAADLTEQIERAEGRITHERARVARMLARLAKKPESLAAEAALPAAREAVAASEEAVNEAMAEIERTDHRATLVAVHDLAESALEDLDPEYLLSQVGEIRRLTAAALAANPKQNRARLQSLTADRNAAAQHLAAAELAAAALDELALCEVEQATAEQAIGEEDDLLAVLTWRLRIVEARQVELATTAHEAGVAAARWAEEARRLGGLLDAAGKREQTQGRLAALREQERAARARVVAAEQALTEARDDSAAFTARWSRGPLPTASRQRDLEQQVRQLERQLARIEVTVRQREEEVRLLGEERAALDLMERDLGDLAALLRALDKKGIQAFEADAIGTEIADHATDLLQAHGFRWILTYDPLRESGKREVEQARWKLVEQDTGLEYDARSTNGGSSGGQEVIVATAIFLAAGAAVVRRGGGVKDATLTIDEMTSAVREPLVESWLAMLRDGAARNGAKLVLLVPPNDARLVGACDGVITVEPTERGSVVR